MLYLLVDVLLRLLLPCFLCLFLVEVSVKARNIVVKGPLGTLTRDFKHLKLDLTPIQNGKAKQIKADLWFGNRKELATLRTFKSHVDNMITGVQWGYEYKMKFVYAHFPINLSIVDDGKLVEIRNFLGEKVLRTIPMREGVTVVRTPNVKDEITLTGNDIEAVSGSAAAIHCACLVRRKDIRKFLDGMYVSSKKVLKPED